MLPLNVTVPPATYVCTTVETPTLTSNVFVDKLLAVTANLLLCVSKSILLITLLVICFNFVIAALVSVP